ncbi:MAG TPA: hypothetical protein VKD72_25040 [Gemmataceae bacterium]|nr:hypothetical protein [Gemmataceae bacterium]
MVPFGRGRRDRPGPPVRKDLRVLPDPLGPPDQRVRLGVQGPAPPGRPGPMAHPARWGPRVQAALSGLRARAGRLVRRATQARLALRARPATQAHGVLRGLPVRRDLLVLPERKVLRVPLEPRDQRARVTHSSPLHCRPRRL